MKRPASASSFKHQTEAPVVKQQPHVRDGVPSMEVYPSILFVQKVILVGVELVTSLINIASLTSSCWKGTADTHLADEDDPEYQETLRKRYRTPDLSK